MGLCERGRMLAGAWAWVLGCAGFLAAGNLSLSVNGGARIDLSDANAVVRSISASPLGGKIGLTLYVRKGVFNETDASLHFQILPSGEWALALARSGETAGETAYSGVLDLSAALGAADATTLYKLALDRITLLQLVLPDGWVSIDAIDTEEKFNQTSVPADWDPGVPEHDIRQFNFNNDVWTCGVAFTTLDIAIVKDINWNAFQQLQNDSAVSACYGIRGFAATVPGLAAPIQTATKWFSTADVIRRLPGTQIFVPNKLFHTLADLPYPIVSDAHAVEVWACGAIARFNQVTDADGLFLTQPSITDARVLSNGATTALALNPAASLRTPAGDLGLAFAVSSPDPDLPPAFLHSILFRPDAAGNLRIGTGSEEYIEKGPFTAGQFGWGAIAQVFKPGEFRRVSGSPAPPGFPEGVYDLKIEVHSLDGLVAALDFPVKIQEDPVLLPAQALRKSADELDFTFQKMKVGSRFDAGVAVSSQGPFALLTRDVIDQPPPALPWEPFTRPAGEQWEFAASSAQVFSASLQAVRDRLGLRALPPTLYFRFRAVLEGGQAYVGDPFAAALPKSDGSAPALTVEQESGGRVRVADLGAFTNIRGTLWDASPWGASNLAAVYLDAGGVVLSSAVFQAPDRALTAWSLQIPESRAPLLPNGPHPATLHAFDSDGNETAREITLDVDVAPFDLAVPDPLPTRSDWADQDGKRRGFIDFNAQGKEDSFLTVAVDGRVWAGDWFTGGERRIAERFYADAPLAPGPHPAQAVLQRGDWRKEVSFTLLVGGKGGETGELEAGGRWDLRFSPNGDGVNDVIAFDPEDLPVAIAQFRRGRTVKTVTEGDGGRWDGRGDDGGPCETGVYLARTRRGRKLVISLYR